MTLLPATGDGGRWGCARALASLASSPLCTHSAACLVEKGLSLSKTTSGPLALTYIVCACACAWSAARRVNPQPQNPTSPPSLEHKCQGTCSREAKVAVGWDRRRAQRLGCRRKGRNRRKGPERGEEGAGGRWVGPGGARPLRLCPTDLRAYSSRLWAVCCARADCLEPPRRRARDARWPIANKCGLDRCPEAARRSRQMQNQGHLGHGPWRMCVCVAVLWGCGVLEVGA